MQSMPDELIKAVREYYEWHGDRNGRPVKFVTCKHGLQGTMVLARFINADGVWKSSLMIEQHWADGHYDVTEIYYCDRKLEKAMVKSFVNSPNGELYCDEYFEEYDEEYSDLEKRLGKQ